MFNESSLECEETEVQGVILQQVENIKTIIVEVRRSGCDEKRAHVVWCRIRHSREVLR